MFDNNLQIQTGSGDKRLSSSLEDNFLDNPPDIPVKESSVFPKNNQHDKSVFISTYGCQMNINDTERMYSLLEMSNYRPVNSADQASLIIINSCSVREKPVHKVHSEVGRYRKLKEKKPWLRIGVTGCVAQQEKKQLFKDVPLIDFVCGTDAIDELPQIVAQVVEKKEKVVSARFQHQESYQIETLIRNVGVSTFVNITKGCDNFCSFCVVPFTRGRERSRPLMELVKDINSLVSRGVKEVTLLGQNVNSYKSPCEADFPKLLKVLATDTDIQRIRYTTSHPKDFNEKLCQVMQDHREKICNYVHLPVQSGNSEVLERMNRGYSREDYLKKVEMIQKMIPGVTISTDIIVGFPGETEAQFQDTLSLFDEVAYEGLFAYKYSPRPFTKAIRYENNISNEESSERLQRLFAKNKALAFKLAKKYEGQTLKVLVEKYEEETQKNIGRSTQNKLVHFKSSQNLVGETMYVKINEAFPQNLRGKIQEEVC